MKKLLFSISALTVVFNYSAKAQSVTDTLYTESHYNVLCCYYTVPIGVDTILVECWGAGTNGVNGRSGGGLGGPGGGQDVGGSGGGGGAYARSVINVVAGSTYPYKVDNCGYSVGPFGFIELASGTSFNNKQIFAESGSVRNGGGGLGGENYIGIGGHDSSSIGQVKFSGGNGYGGGGGGIGYYIGGAGGGGGGTKQNGGVGKGSDFDNLYIGGKGGDFGGGDGGGTMLNGGFPGGGGGGGNGGAIVGGRPGGKGGQGMILITYTLPKVSRTTDIVNHLSITISPNPFKSSTTIAFKEEQRNTVVKVIDILGKEINSQTFSGKEFVLEKGAMQAGIYFVYVMDNKNNKCIRKVIVQ